MTIGGTTKVMGVIGDPVHQIRTPEFINPIFARLGADIVCLPLHIAPGELETAWRGLGATANVIGFGITLPHKQAALALCDTVDAAAGRVGAVNLVRRERDGSLRGYQFDGDGFCAGLEAEGHRLAGRDCLMVGAGGAAMAVAIGLADAGIASLTVANRTAARAETLVALANTAAGRNVAHTGPAEPRGGQLVINATSLGLSPDDPLPLDPATLDGTMLVAEVIAKPEFTPLLDEARRRGAAVHSGLHMLRAQVEMIAGHMAELWGRGS